MPAVSYLKAAEYQDGHPGYSDPLDEQNFIVNTVNEIEQSKYWSSTAIVITYDDSDGWYDHQPSTIVNGSNDSARRHRDLLLGAGHGSAAATTAAATARACRWSSSRPGPGTTTSATT